MTGKQLWDAARDGDSAKVSTLLSTQGAQSYINYQDAKGASALHIAAEKGHASVTEQLIAARCNIGLQEKSGYHAAHLAAAKRHAAVTEQLIAARCDVNLQNNITGNTLLHITAITGDEAVTKQLLAVRCNVDLQDTNGLTALQAAERLGHAGVATLIRNKRQDAPLLRRRVAINGLVAKPELNGRTGTAVSFDDDKGRYSVEIDDTSSFLLIKPCNLLPTQVCSVDLCSLLFSHVQTSRAPLM
jgi:hypothetical protein